MSNVERNKTLVSKFLDALGNSDAAYVVDALDDEGAIQTMGRTAISGTFKKDILKDMSKEILGAFPQGLKIRATNMVGEGDYVAVEAESNARHISGKTYNNFYHFLFRFRNGKILLLKEYLDTEHVTEVLCGGRAS